MAWIKKSNKFLPEISKEELKKRYAKEKNAKAKLRLLASIQRKEGKTLDDIAYSLQKPKTTIHDWLKRVDDNQLNNVYDKKQPGKPSRLTNNQLKELDKILNSSPEKQNIPFTIWTTKLVQYVILKNFNVKYQLWNIRKISHGLKFSLKVPRQQHIKADKKAQEKFKEELKKKFNITLNLNSRSFVLMKHTSS